MIIKVLRFINLHTGEAEKNDVLDNVKVNISFRGSNLWILACAIIVASIGLNMNSTAVVIGAMLISPLMGPIVGAGFALGMYDFDLLKKALKNLFIATLVGLFVSAIYFYLSPFKDTQSEILSRTSPTIYDILIAFFGGLVGVIAITRVEKGNPIPGVAIATALMPPLCTAGYGLATANLNFFFGAIFLYTINCVFIFIATLLIVKYLKYPAVKFVNKKQQTVVKYSVTSLILVIMIPSIYFAYKLVIEKKYSEKIETFISKEFTEKGHTLLYKHIDDKSSPKKIQLAFLNKKFNVEELKNINSDLAKFDIKNTKIQIIQDTVDIKKRIIDEINSGRSNINEKDIIIARLEKAINENKYNNVALLAETKILFPEIEDISISNHLFNNDSKAPLTLPVLIYTSKTELSQESMQQLKHWMEKRLSKEKIEIYRQEVKTEPKKK